MTAPKTPYAKDGKIAAIDTFDQETTAAMVGLFKQGQAPHHEAFPEHFGPADDDGAIASYLRSFFKPRNPLRKHTGYAIGWYAQGTLKGYLLYRLYRSRDIFYGKPRWHCYVEDIVVDANARGTGAGSAMMAALLDKTAPLKNCCIAGTVWQMNSASQALFTRHGFEARSQTFYKVNP
jgi:ribosomal protein S18 acetylase RimI-like enzyme